MPVIGQEVWSSGEITATQGWTSVTNLDVSSKVTAAGTYYLKVAVWLETPGSNTGPFTIGYDNVIANWSKTTIRYVTDRPMISPTASLNVIDVAHWNSFTETATKNGGEIYYQLSNNDGATWQYWNGSAWTSAGATNYNIASVINANIGTFSATNKKIMWKAFLESNGTQQVILADLAVGYTTNNSPEILNLVSSQDTVSGLVHIDYDLRDTESDPASLVTYEYSLTGAFAGEQVVMTASTTDPSHSGIVGLSSSPAGVAHTFVWDTCANVGNIYSTTTYVRLRANDGIINSSYVTSSAFTIDCVAPAVDSVLAAQAAGSTDVIVTYNLTDDTATDLLVELDISNDGGSTWMVTDTSVTGDVGSGLSAGNGKMITWAAGVDFDGQQQNSMRVRVRAKDQYQNQSDYAASADFTLDTLDPAINASTDLQAQPNAGETSVLISGSFTETNPNTNNFYVAINDGGYNAATAGDANTATPSTQATMVGATLDGNDYISKVKITHTDDYGQSTDNENTSPAIAYRFVKPYTPPAPTLSDSAPAQLNLTINSHVAETNDLEYVIYETTQAEYVQSDGTLGAGAVWQALGTAAGQWGDNTGESGKVTINGLSLPLASYIFEVKSRNTSDTSYAASSESAPSASASITNTAPSVTINSVVQQTGGANYVLIGYTGVDAQNDTNSITTYEYSTDNSSWFTMTEKNGVGSDGTSGLVFTATGAGFVFAWDSGTDLPDKEDSTVYVRLQSTDTLAASSLTVSSAFEVDNVGPVISNVLAGQTPGTDNIVFTYDLNDNAGADNIVMLDISDDSGATWTVTDTSVAGDVGAGVTAGANRSIIWSADADFNGEEQSDLKVRIKATDSYGNVGSFTESSDFAIDTAGPIISNVNASQGAGLGDVVITYDLADGSVAEHLVEIGVSDDDGITWGVATSTVSGDIGMGQTTGSKTMIWRAKTDFDGEAQNDMRIRVKATDRFGNQGSYAQSSDFTLDTANPVIANLSAIQNLGAGSVTISYDLSDDTVSSTTVEMDISNDGGATWTVTDTSSTGAVGSGVAADAGKIIIWDARNDFNNEEQNDMRIRLRAADSFGNISIYFESANFTVDTAEPLGLSILSKFTTTATTATLTWSGAVTDANFNHYELWHSSISGDVDNRTGTASKWDDNNDANLSNIHTISTIITGLSLTSNYYVKIWAVDDYGNETTCASINLYEVPAPVSAPAPAASAAGGGSFLPPDITAPGQPTLASVSTPTNLTAVIITGLAEPRSRIDLYDNNNLAGRLSSATGENGIFYQEFTLGEGNHILSVKAVDFSNNTSVFSNAVNMTVDLTPPAAPILFSPSAGEQITDATPELIGIGEPAARINILIDGIISLNTLTDNNGSWRLILPSEFALADGSHNLIISATDEAGNKSAQTSVGITKVALSAGVSIVSPAVPSIPVSAGAGITEITEAVELPGVPVPSVTNISLGIIPDTIQFTGVSLPNKEVVVYVHSDQALVYRTRTNSKGVWTISHSQNVVELSSGQHSVFAVTIDPIAKVRSRASAVSLFVVEKSFWISLFNLLNLPTTIITLAVMLLIMTWLYRLRTKTS